VVGNNEDTTLTIDGASFVVADNLSIIDGGMSGVSVEGGSTLQLSNAIVRDNRSEYGGAGISVTGSTLLLTDAVIDRNTGGYDGYGGGIDASQDSHIELERVVLSKNDVGYGDGGGIAIHSGATAVLTDVVLEGNAATSGGGVYAHYANLVGNRSIPFVHFED